SGQLESEFGLADFEPVGEVSRVSVDIGGASDKEDPAVMTLSYNIKGISGTAGNYDLMKLIDKGVEEDRDLYRKFEYVEEGSPEDAGNGDWWLTDLKGDYLGPDKKLSSSDVYTINYKVKDNGGFDLDDEWGKIEDPTVLGSSDSEDTDDDGSDDGSTDDGGGGGSSGCFINSLMR
ncbi:MAG: hypothetical protein ACOCQI_06760, partial [Desulfosalsimonas sp.]